VGCGNEINAKRLEAVPWTRYCIECQEKLENGQLEEAQG
jgi:DnaK suppressor protein